MLNGQRRSKSKAILRNFDIHLKQNLENFVEAIPARIRSGCLRRDFHQNYGNSNLMVKNIVDALKSDLEENICARLKLFGEITTH